MHLLAIHGTTKIEHNKIVSENIVDLMLKVTLSVYGTKLTLKIDWHW